MIGKIFLHPPSFAWGLLQRFGTLIVDFAPSSRSHSTPLKLVVRLSKALLAHIIGKALPTNGANLKARYANFQKLWNLSKVFGLFFTHLEVTKGSISSR